MITLFLFLRIFLQTGQVIHHADPLYSHSCLHLGHFTCCILITYYLKEIKVLFYPNFLIASLTSSRSLYGRLSRSFRIAITIRFLSYLRRSQNGKCVPPPGNLNVNSFCFLIRSPVKNCEKNSCERCIRNTNGNVRHLRRKPRTD